MGQVFDLLFFFHCVAASFKFFHVNNFLRWMCLNVFGAFSFFVKLKTSRNISSVTCVKGAIFTNENINVIGHLTRPWLLEKDCKIKTKNVESFIRNKLVFGPQVVGEA